MTTIDSGQEALKDEQSRLLEFEKIVQFRDSITSGKHPRIKVPAHLLPAISATASNARPAASRPKGPRDVSTIQPTKPDTSKSKNQARSVLGHQDNAWQSAGVVTLPGLGFAPIEPTAGGGSDRWLDGATGPAQPADPIQAHFALQRANLEKALLEQGAQQASKEIQIKDALPSFDINDVWQMGIACEQTFTPPPGVALRAVTDAKGAAGTAGAGSDRNGSADDLTFYSSNFSTPEFGQTARIPIESGNDDVSMEEGSDYEPELDVVPSPVVPVLSLPVSKPAQPAPPPLSQGNAGLPAVDEPRQPPSPFVRVHDLSPVAPRPTHAAAIVVEHLASELQARGTPAQITALWRGPAGQSSPESSPQTAGSRTDKRKAKKRNNKRKADQTAAVSSGTPTVKQEPISPAPIVAPPAQRAAKRQRYATRSGPNGRSLSGQDHVVSESYTAPLPPLRDDRMLVAYERPAAAVEQYGHAPNSGPQQQLPSPQRGWEIYDSQLPASAPPYGPAGAPLVAYGVPPPRTREASHALVEVSPGYARPARGGYGGVYEPGRMSTRPKSMMMTQQRSPTVMAPPPPSRMQYQHPQEPPPAAIPMRVVVDEYGREYYEPPKYAVRQPAVDVMPRPRYESEMAYERVVAPMQPPLRAGSQMPIAYEDDRVVYQRRPSPPYAQPRRVVTQPEFGGYDPMNGQLREYSVMPGPRPGEEPQPMIPPQYARRPMAEEAPREYLARAATAQPPEGPRYEMGPVGGYMEQMGSARPPNVPPGHDFGRPVVYDGRPREPLPMGYELAPREYSVRPEQQQQQQQQQHQQPPPPPPHAVVQRAYSVRPGPAPYYMEQPEGGAMPGYGYPNGGRRDVYR